MQEMKTESNASIIAENIHVQILEKQKSKQFLQKIEEKVAEQLINGSLLLSNNNDDYDNFINHHKKETALKQLNLPKNKPVTDSSHDNQEVNINQNQKQYILTPRLYPVISSILTKYTKEDIAKQKRKEEAVKRTFVQKMKNWSLEKMKIHKHKQQIEMKNKIIENEKRQKAIKQQQEFQRKKKEQKKKYIEAKLLQIQQRRRQRLGQIKESSIKRSQSVPKFIEYQNKFKESQKLKQLQSQIILQNKRQALESNLQKIKQHEKAYIERIKQRLNMKSLNKDKIDKSQQQKINKNENFNIYKKNASEIQKIQEKIKKIKKFQQKVRLMPIKIDEAKRKEIQIKGDKLKNFKKYNFLSQKALSDDLIYQEFKNFNVDINEKQLGNKYFEQIKQYTKNNKRKASSQKVFPSNKPEYKNYLAELRQQKNGFKERSKSLGLQNLIGQSEQYEHKAFQNINELKNISSYHDSLKKQEQMDSNYMKAIEAKLALAKKN